MEAKPELAGNAGSGPFPLSFEQQSIWLSDQLQGDASRYIDTWVHTLRGILNLEALESALGLLIRRHELLRSAVGVYAGIPGQIVFPPGEVPLVIRTVEPGDLDDAIQSAVRIGISLDRPPLLQATLLRVADTDCSVLAMAIHHVVTDGWSFQLLGSELTELYNAIVQSRVPALAEPLQMRTYVRSSEITQRYEAVDKDLAYWRKVLSGAPALSTFAPDHVRPQRLSHEGRRLEFEISEDLGRKIQLLCREMRVSPFVVASSALAVLLAQRNRRGDVVLGTSMSRRDRTELNSLLACLTDMVPVRLFVASECSFTDIVRAAQRAIVSAIEHRSCSFSQIVREVKVRPRLDAFPLFQVAIAVDDGGDSGLRLDGVDAQQLYVHPGTAKFDVFVELIPARQGFRGFWEYSSDLFDAASSAQLSAEFRSVLAAAVERPTEQLRNLAHVGGLNAPAP